MILGVSLIILRKDGKILIVQETEEKPWKKPGDFSIPMETKEENETYRETINRAIEEEAKGVLEYEIERINGKEDYNIMNLALARCFIVKVIKHEKHISGNEVKNHKWLFPEEVLNLPLRIKAKEMIEDFISNLKQTKEKKSPFFILKLSF